MNWRRLLPGILIIAGLGAYHNSLTGPFIFDDYNAIVHNEHIRELWPVWDAMAAPPQSTVAGRPVVSVSLAINYALGGLNVWGYHVFNVSLHILSALLLFGIVRRTLAGDRVGARYSASSTELALTIPLIWVVHPLLSESVNYLGQRTELLVGCFYLLTLYCVIRGRDSARRQVWYAGAVAACALGMGSNEVMVSAPMLVLLYDRTFWTSSFRQALRNRRWLYAGLAATWLALAASLMSRPSTETVGFGFKELTPLHYALTQAGVIVHYLRLALWPSPLVLDYSDWPVARTLAAVVPAGLVIGALLAATVWALRRRLPVGVLGAWFFLILGPSSSFVPIASEVMSERRMYLPLAAVVTLAVLGLRAVLRRVGGAGQIGLVAVVVISFGVVTVRRNEDYRSETAIWRDTVAKRPGNSRVRVKLGMGLVGQGEVEAGMEQYRAALRANPRSAEAAYNLGLTLAGQGKLEEAVENLTRAVQLEPGSPLAHYQLGLVRRQQGQLEDAVDQLKEAVRLSPGNATNHNSLGAVLAQAGRFDEATMRFREALRLQPDFADAHYNLGLALAHQDKLREAVQSFQAAVRLNPNLEQARRSLDKLAGRLQPEGATGPD